jgi:hypothetical protein
MWKKLGTNFLCFYLKIGAKVQHFTHNITTTLLHMIYMVWSNFQRHKTQNKAMWAPSWRGPELPSKSLVRMKNLHQLETPCKMNDLWTEKHFFHCIPVHYLTRVVS